MQFNKTARISLVVIKLAFDFDFKSFLRLLPVIEHNKILSYYKIEDQLRAFASSLLKYYYLAKCLNLNPAQIKINYTPDGKPYLDLLGCNLKFNISHSGEYVIMAITDNLEVGVDIEEIDLTSIYQDVMKLIFSSAETSQVKSLTDFYHMFGKKEAYLKALGIGFGADLITAPELNLDLYQHGIIDEFKHYHLASSTNLNKYLVSLCIIEDQRNSFSTR